MDKLTSTQLSEWQAYDSLDPIGSWRVDFASAMIQSTLVNIYNSFNRSKDDPPAEISNASHFLPIWDKVERDRRTYEEQHKQSMEEMRASLMAFAKVHNKKVVDKVKNAERLKRIPTKLKPK